MRTKKLLLPVVFITILLLFSNFGFSQSSIYHDAKELAKYLKEDWSIYVEFQKDKSSNATLTIVNDTKTLSEYAENKYVFSEYSNYSIKVNEYDESYPDSIIIFSKDSIIQKIPANFDVVFQHAPNNKLIGWRNRNIPQMDSIAFISSYRDNSFQQDKIEYINESESESAYRILFNLGAHANFKDVNNSQELKFQEIQKFYSNNPFLNNSKIESPLFYPNVDLYFWHDLPEDEISNISSQYNKNHLWQKLLYGDSLLQFQKTVSFKDASSSYRKRIVTSQNELTDASIRINQTGRSKNLLDAKTVAVGLSDFIAERAQEELNLTFFNRFKRNLEKPSELTVLFPNTKNLLYQFEISNYKTLLSHARESFTVDLENLGLNFPEVFNLALIYSIADLAYKEQPVENILIAGFQKLRERKVELKKSINIQLADSFLGHDHSAKNPSNRFSNTIKNPKELQLLKTQIIKYIETADYIVEMLNDNQTDLAMMYNQMEETSMYKKMTFGEKAEYQNRTDYLPTQAIDFLDESLYEPIIYNNRKIFEFSCLDFYQKIIPANLDGKQYYGYLLSAPKLQDYTQYFKNKPDSINSIIAEGIENTRNLLNKNLEELLNQTLTALKKNAQYNRTLLKEELLKNNKEFAPQNRIFDLNSRAQLLGKTIEEEITFWETYTQLDKTNHHIAGLHFLAALVYNNYNIYSFDSIGQGIQIKLMTFDSIQKKYPRLLGDKFEESINQTFAYLDSIQINLDDKTKMLAKEFGSINLNNSKIQRKFLNTKFYQDSLIALGYDWDSRKQLSLFSFKKFLIDRIFDPNFSMADLPRNVEPIDIKMDSLVYVHRDLKKRITNSQEKLGESKDEDEKSRIQIKIDQLKNSQNKITVKRKT